MSLYIFYQSFLKLITQLLFNAKSLSVFPPFSELSIQTRILRLIVWSISALRCFESDPALTYINVFHLTQA